MEWREKPFHGKHPLTQDQLYLDRDACDLWLRRGDPFREPEGSVKAIQDKVVGARNYRKHILRYNVDDKCQLCENPSKSIEYIIDGRRMLLEGEYTSRHNNVLDYLPRNSVEHVATVRLETQPTTRSSTSS